MEIVTGAINTLLPKLGKLLVGEYKLQKGVKREIESLQKELISLGAALHKVSEMPVDQQLDEQVKIWARDVRELSYDIEDVIDTFMVSSQGRTAAKILSFKGLVDRASSLFKKVVARRQIAREVKGIKKLLDDASRRRERYKVDDDAATVRSTVSVDPRIGAMYIKETELVGIDEPKNVLVKALMEGDGTLRKQQQKIVSIVGFGGLGKTTLANALLHELKVDFDCHFFISVSLKPDMRKILRSILHQIDDNIHASIYEGLQDLQLINKIGEILQNKRFLCVIDDIWEESVWDVIKLALLQDGNHGSKIITTTRKMAVAKRVGGVVYELKPLSDVDANKLFSKRIFGIEDECPLNLSKITKSILKKCGGLPLAIITIASLLANKPMHTQEWEKVNNSIGYGLGNSLDVANMRNILSLSYYDLPPHLKTCLLYLSKYPEDKIIMKDILIWSWIAEGFIDNNQGEHGKSLHEIGECYFNELMNKNLIQAVNIGRFFYSDGKVHACQVHDMVLELINQLSAEEGFVTTMSVDGQKEGIVIPTVEKKLRRLSCHYKHYYSFFQETYNRTKNTYATTEARERLSQVRSFTVFGRVRFMPSLPIFRVLRVLQLEDCYYLEDNHLNDIAKLHHLRFLRLRNVTKLPECIGNLQVLQTLDITSEASSEVQLPPSFFTLRQLVRLIAHRLRLPDGVTLKNMRSLQELKFVGVTEDLMQELCGLTDLRILNLKLVSDDDGDIFREAFINCLHRHNNLQHLTLKTPGLYSLDFMQGVPSCLQRFVSNGPFYRGLPRWINSSLSCLNILSIVLRNCMKQEYLVTLSELPSLQFLRIDVESMIDAEDMEMTDADDMLEDRKKFIIHNGPCAFRCLQEFHFGCDIMGLSFQPRAMQQLQSLCLRFLARETIDFYGEIDFGLENLPSLRHVYVGFNSYSGLGREIQEAKAAIKKAINDHYNHPSLSFGYAREVR